MTLKTIYAGRTRICFVYKCIWHEYNGIRNNPYRRQTIHANSLSEAKQKCFQRYGEYPTLIKRV